MTIKHVVKVSPHKLFGTSRISTFFLSHQHFYPKIPTRHAVNVYCLQGLLSDFLMGALLHLVCESFPKPDIKQAT